jgi:hypothetical protein
VLRDNCTCVKRRWGQGCGRLGIAVRKTRDVIIAGSVSTDEAKELFGSWDEPKPYIRIVPDPSRVAEPVA